MTDAPVDTGERIEHPAKLLRIATMARQLLAEVRAAPLDGASRTRLREMYETSVRELADNLSDPLEDELARMAPAFDDEATPSDAELRVAQAQLVGWLEGLFQGIQTTLISQHASARDQLQRIQRPGPEPPPGTYL